MPARNPSGAATSSDTRMIGCMKRIGCQPAPQRASTTRPKTIAPKRQNIQAARIHPGPRRERRHGPCCVGEAGTWWSAVTAVTCSVSPLLAGLDQVLDERVELVLRQVERRHDVRVE